MLPAHAPAAKPTSTSPNTTRSSARHRSATATRRPRPSAPHARSNALPPNHSHSTRHRSATTRTCGCMPVATNSSSGSAHGQPTDSRPPSESSTARLVEPRRTTLRARTRDHPSADRAPRLRRESSRAGTDTAPGATHPSARPSARRPGTDPLTAAGATRTPDTPTRTARPRPRALARQHEVTGRAQPGGSAHFVAQLVKRTSRPDARHGACGSVERAAAARPKRLSV